MGKVAAEKKVPRRLSARGAGNFRPGEHLPQLATNRQHGGRQKVLQIRRFLAYFDFVPSSLPILTEACREELSRCGVQALYLFGSRAMGYEHARSDYDYAVLMKEEGHKRGDALYDKIYDLLSVISPRTLENDVIDIVFLRDVGLELRFHVIRHGRVLFESDPNERMNFEARTTLLYCDYRPVLDEFDRNLLESL